MDTEICLINLCLPQMDTDMDSLLSRLTRIEDRMNSGDFVPASAPVTKPESTVPIVAVDDFVEEPVISNDDEPAEDVPIGFWNDIASEVRRELNPALSGFFATSANAPVHGVLHADKLSLVCGNKFIVDIINKPDVLELVSRKASAKLGKKIRVTVTDQEMSGDKNEQMEQLLDFGRAHSGVINIKEN